MSFKDDISEAKSKEFNYIHKANEDFADDIIESNTNCWSCGTDIPLGKKYCEFHCGHPADEFDSFTGQCTACGKSLNVNMMMAMPIAESKATEVKIERADGSMTIDGKQVIKIWESFNGWYWYAVEDRGQYTGIDYDGNDVEAHAWFGYVQGEFNEWGTFDSKELERAGVWEVPRSNWAYTGRMEESKASESRKLNARQKKLIDEWVGSMSSPPMFIQAEDLPYELYTQIQNINDYETLHQDIGRYASDVGNKIAMQGSNPYMHSSDYGSFESKSNEGFIKDMNLDKNSLRNYDLDSLINMWKDAKAYYQNPDNTWEDEDAEFYDELAVVINEKKAQAGEMNAKTLTDNWFNIGNGLAQCKHCTFQSGSWSEFAEHLEEAHGIGEDEDSDFVSFESSEDVMMYEPSNDPSGVGFWWDFESPMNDMKHEQISSLLGIDHNKAWGFLTKEEQDRVSNYKLNKVMSSEKEELLSDIIAKINAKYSGDDEEEEEANEDVTFGHGWDAQDGWTDDMLLDRINRGNTDYDHLTDQELDAWRRSTGQATSDIGSTPIGGRGSKHNNYSIYNDPVLPYGESNATEDWESQQRGLSDSEEEELIEQTLDEWQTRYLPYTSAGQDVSKSAFASFATSKNLTQSEIDYLWDNGANPYSSEVHEEEEEATEDSPCWDGYEQIGMKDKDGKQVPNCVPKDGE